MKNCLGPARKASEEASGRGAVPPDSNTNRYSAALGISNLLWTERQNNEPGSAPPGVLQYRKPRAHMSSTVHPTPTVVQRYFEISLFLLVTVGFLTLATTGKLDLPSLLLVAGLLGYKALRYRRHHSPELAPSTVTWLTWSYFAFYAVDYLFLSRGFLVATVHLVLFTAVVKVFSARVNRDYLYLALLAFLEMLAAATLTVSTAYLVFFTVFLLIGISTFISYEIKHNAETTRSVTLVPGSPVAVRLQRALMLTSVAVSASILLLGTVIFFILPRFSTGYLSGMSLQPELITGFSDNVELGEIGQIKRNPAVVMRVKTDGDPRELAGLRWRGVGLTQFDGHRWFNEPAESAVITRGPTGRFYFRRVSYPGLHTRRVEYRVILEPVSTDALFAAAIAEEIHGRFRYLALDPTETIINPEHNYAKISYEVVSNTTPLPAAWLRADSTEYPPEIRGPYLQLPEMNERVRLLAEQVTAEQPTVYDKAATLEQYLRTKYGYTLDLPRVLPADPIGSFLFETRRGHCEYFASAMTVMLRSVGIPARLVNGFLTGDYNDVGSDYVVRASDAHTWVEVYFPSHGWVAFDPTPPSTDQPQRTVWTRLGQYLDAIDLMWSEWVINYDLSHQLTLARNLERSTRSWSLKMQFTWRRWRRNLVDEMKQMQGRVTTSPYALPAAIGLLVLVVAALRARSLRDFFLGRSWMLRRHAGRISPREATLTYLRLLKLLARRGMRKAPSQTPLEFAENLPRADLRPAVIEFTALYNAIRFGRRPADPVRLLDLLRLIKNPKTT